MKRWFYGLCAAVALPLVAATPAYADDMTTAMQNVQDGVIAMTGKLFLGMWPIVLIFVAVIVAGSLIALVIGRS